MLQAEKEDPNLITVFICFLRSGLRFNRHDTNNVGLAFIEELKRLNPEFKPVKVTQRERDQEYTVNAYPREFEQLILSLIEEYRKKNDLPYRLKKPSNRKGGFSRGSSGGSGGYQGGSRSEGGYQGGNRTGGGYQGGNREGGYQGGNRTGGGYQGGNREGGYQGGNRTGGGYQGGNREGGYQGGNREGGYQGGNRTGGGYQGGSREGGYQGGNRTGGGYQGGNRPDGDRGNSGYSGGNRTGGYQQGGGYQPPRNYSDQRSQRPARDDQGSGSGQRSDNQGYLEGGYRPRTFGEPERSDNTFKRVRENYIERQAPTGEPPISGGTAQNEDKEKPKRLRKDPNESGS